MRYIFLSLSMYLFVNVCSQPFIGIVHYKLEVNNRLSSGNNYIVNIITFYSDSTYQCQYLTFANKKDRLRCILVNREVEKGKWDKIVDTIKCYINYPLEANGRIENFIYKKSKLYYFQYPIDNDFLKRRKKFPWKRIKAVNSDMFFIDR
jgi:hypothetical protein